MSRPSPHRATIKALAEEGYDDAYIAAQVGLGIARTRVIRRSEGIVYPNSKTPAPEVIDEIRRRTEESWPVSEIAETLGISVDSVRTWAGVSPNSEDYRAMCRWARKHHAELFAELRNTRLFTD